MVHWWTHRRCWQKDGWPTFSRIVFPIGETRVPSCSIVAVNPIILEARSSISNRMDTASLHRPQPLRTTSSLGIAPILQSASKTGTLCFRSLSRDAESEGAYPTTMVVSKFNLRCGIRNSPDVLPVKHLCRLLRDLLVHKEQPNPGLWYVYIYRADMRQGWSCVLCRCGRLKIEK